jgi:hypothetical protein
VNGQLEFAKYQGTGNDFLMVVDLDDERPLDPAQVAALCDRRTGVGADGVIRVVRTDRDGARFFMDYANADGSTAEMCGNGIRCVGMLLHDRGLVDDTSVDVLTRAGLKHLTLDGSVGVFPRPVQDPLPIWVAVGGAPESAFRAGTLGLPMALAIIGGRSERFAPFAELFRDAAHQAGHDPLPALSINSHGYIAETSQQAIDGSFPHVAVMMNRIGRERGWQPITREQYEGEATLRGANFVGSPQQVIEKILYQHEIFEHDRLLLQFGVGALPHDKMMRSIELLGTEVAPAVRSELARRTAGAPAS